MRKGSRGHAVARSLHSEVAERGDLEKTMRNRLLKAEALVLATGLALAGCAAEEADDDGEATGEATADALRSGVNSAGCKRSPYNCALNPSGDGQRVEKSGGNDWAVDPAWLAKNGFVDPATKAPVVPVKDGDGKELGRTTKTSFTLNHGQVRTFAGKEHVIALSTGLAAAGWVPIDAFKSAATLRGRVGSVTARGGNLSKMACYEVKSTYPARLDTFKVVRGATDADSEEPNDYLPVKRANGKVYMNLAFSVPGDGLGAPAVDIFPAGTKFQRLDVPTWESGGAPSLDVTLFAKAPGARSYTRPSGSMKFVYGFVKTAPGQQRFGWMALDGLVPSSACP